MTKQVIGVLVSGRGSNFQAILDHIRLGVLQNVEVGILISNNPEARALGIAKNNGIDAAIFIAPEAPEKKSVFERETLSVLETRGVTLVVLAGFTRILSSRFIDRYRWNLMNIHPTLLPAFPGLHPHKQVLERGAKVSGCTVHYVDESVDGGPIVLQHPVQVLEDDTEEALASRILTFEHRLYSKAIQLHVDGRLKLEGGRVRIDYSGGWEEQWNERQRAYVEYQEPRKVS